MPCNYLILCHPLFLLPSIFPNIRVFSNELTFHIRWPNIGASASASVLTMNIQGWFPFGLTGLMSLQSMGLSRVFSSTTIQKVLILWHLAFFLVQLSHLCITTGKTIALTIWTFVGKVMSLLFPSLSRKWQPIPVFLPGESHGQGSLVGCRLWGHTQSDTTEATYLAGWS